MVVYSLTLEAGQMNEQKKAWVGEGISLSKKPWQESLSTHLLVGTGYVGTSSFQGNLLCGWKARLWPSAMPLSSILELKLLALVTLFHLRHLYAILDTKLCKSNIF